MGLAAVASVARTEKPATPAAAVGTLAATVEAKNPWTGLTPNVTADQFQFAIVSDRTGGHRRGIFSRAVQQINLLQPEFVVSVGDLIEGKSTADANRAEWDEFDGYVKKLDMPFFYAPGNHDITAKVRSEVWQERLGRRYYHFTYKDCLFLVLNAYDPGDGNADDEASYKQQRIGKAQREYIAEALKANPAARWTFLFIHPPIWVAKNLTETGWMEVEQLLAGRKYTVFAGHIHRYRKFLRNGMNYYQLATTGGASPLRGAEYGEFDQVTWVTFKNGTPVVANVLLSGIQNDTLTPFASDEDGRVPMNAGQVPVTGTVTLRGKPAAGLSVLFTPIQAGGAGKNPATADARVREDGTFDLRGSGLSEIAGLKPGRYAVTFALAQPLVIDGQPRENPIAERYQRLNTTPFRVEVTADGPNRFPFDLE